MTPRSMVVLAGAFLLAAAWPAAGDAQRRPLQAVPRTEVRVEQTTVYSRYDSTQQRIIRYGTEARVEYLSDRGAYRASWIGTDGRLKSFIQEPRNRVKAVVACEVAYDPATSRFRYSYIASTLPSSPQQLQTVYIEAAGDMMEAAPDTTWMSLRFTPFLKSQLGVEDGVVWARVFGQQLGVPPGESAGPFRITSPNPPGVVRVAVQGTVSLPTVEEEPPDELIFALRAAESNWPMGWTIGPVAASDVPADPALHLAWLEAQLAVAEEEGWLGAGEQARRVRVPLGEARAALQSDEPSRARSALQRGTADIQTIQDDSLLSEARALLLFHMGKVREAIR